MSKSWAESHKIANQETDDDDPNCECKAYKNFYSLIVMLGKPQTDFIHVVRKKEIMEQINI